MIISNILGGFGNQLFQFACGQALALRSQQTAQYSIDLYASYGLHHGLMLDKAFELPLPVATPESLRQCLGPVHAGRGARRWMARLPVRAFMPATFFSERPGMAARDLLSRLNRQAQRGSVYLHGHWQSEAYFADQAEAVRAALRWRPAQGPHAALNNEWARRIQAAPVAVSLHARRGDYITSKKNQSIYAACSPAYYEASLQRLQALAPSEGMQIFAFSDDPAWVRETLMPRWPRLQLIDHNRSANSHQDMRLMSLCRHHVIANSSFSWWGAWLNAKADKRVIAPAQWYADGRDSSELVPKGWQRL